MHYDIKFPFCLSAYEKHGANCVIINQDGEILLQLRDDIPNIANPNSWALIGGHVDEGETPEQAVVREIQEETGLIVDIDNLVWFGDSVNPANNALDRLFVTRVCAGNDNVVRGEGQDLGFFSYEETKSMFLVPLVRVHLEKIFELGVPKMVATGQPLIDIPFTPL